VRAEQEVDMSAWSKNGLDRLDGECNAANSASGRTSPYESESSAQTSCQTRSGRFVGHGYNADNDPTSILYPNGKTVTQTFNNNDQLASATDWLSNKSSFSYTPDSQLQTITFPGEGGSGSSYETDTYTYNLDDAMTGVGMNQNTRKGNSVLASLTLTPDPSDLITKAAQTGLAGPASDTYAYTPTEQLQSDTPIGGSSASYTYDPAGNITQLNNSGASSYSYNAQSELITSPAGGYNYNNVGERTTFTPTGGTTTSYTYDANQDLTGVSGGTGSASYIYNGSGELLSATNGSTTTPFTWNATNGVATLLAAGNQSYIYGPDGRAYEQVSSSGTVQYLHHDQIGSTRLITDTSANVLRSQTYTPYGGLLTSSGTITSNLGYAGEYTDPTTGFTYNQARWYDPATGQFMVVDPKVETTWQAYAYGGDNPVSNTDPTGLKWSPAMGCTTLLKKAAASACIKATVKALQKPHASLITAAESAISTLVAVDKKILKVGAKAVAAAAPYVSAAIGGVAFVCAVATTPLDPACGATGGVGLGVASAGTLADTYLAATEHRSGMAIPFDTEGTGIAALGRLVEEDPTLRNYATAGGLGLNVFGWLAGKFEDKYGGR